MKKQDITPPYYPIIYVRGYAMSQGGIEETVADPYMGFNKGSTKIRQLWTGNVVRYYFESPLIRLMKELDYRDVYLAGKEMHPQLEISPKSIFIYRYYDKASKDIPDGKRQEIEEYALGLGRLIIKIRERICGEDPDLRGTFRVYLVAHSMGGLICRCLLQNHEIEPDDERNHFMEIRSIVDKVFTYATPHNGIDVRHLGNIPSFLTGRNADNFNRSRMRKYLSLPPSLPNVPDDNVASLNGQFDPDRFFCLVGTNHRDYAVAGGVARHFIGPMSDGLVKIENATTWGPFLSGATRAYRNSPRAYVHRSHSGHYGIVNSEEGYQNLKRFLFGNLRVDAKLEIDDITLPPAVNKAYKQGKKVRASYHFETIVRTRGALWDLHRRTVDNGSAIFRTYDEIKHAAENRETPRHPHLFSVFLRIGDKVNMRRRSLGFCVDLGILVPEYEIDEKLWFDQHYDGGYLYRDKVNLELIPPDRQKPSWRLNYGLDSNTPNRATKNLVAEEMPDYSESIGDYFAFWVPIEQKSRPGIKAYMVLSCRYWNDTNPSDFLASPSKPAPTPEFA